MVVQIEIALRLSPETRLVPRVLARPQCISKLNDSINSTQSKAVAPFTQFRLFCLTYILFEM